MGCEIKISGMKCEVPEGKCPLISTVGPRLASLGGIERSIGFLRRNYNKCPNIETAVRITQTTATKLSTNELPITIDGDTIANV